MFKIVSPTKALVAFLLFLKLRLSAPQQRHLTNFMEALLACDGRKTIAKLNRLILNPRDQSAFTDFFTYSPWDNDDLRLAWTTAVVNWVIGYNEGRFIAKPIFIDIDDSKSPKPKTSLHFEVVDWHFNTEEGRGYNYAAVFVTVHISCGNRSGLVALRLYLRQSTVRRLNRYREKGQRIPFRSKNTLVLEILKQLAQLLPHDVPVYVLFDRWYASKKLIRFCRCRSWHVICALKRNRTFRPNGKSDFCSLSRWARYMRKKDFTEVVVKSSDSSTRYWVHTLRGHLKGMRDEVSIMISKRYPGDRKPEFFLVTDLSLTAQEALNYYGNRWEVEVDHLYLKVHLGLSDFRLRSYEGITKYFDLVGLTLFYLQWRKHKEQTPKSKTIDPETLAQEQEVNEQKDKEQSTDIKTLSDVIALHRREQQSACLRAFGKYVLECGSVDQAVAYWYKQAA